MLPSLGLRELLDEPAPCWDPYDVWATPVGVRIRRMYYEGSVLGKAAAAGLQGADLLLPGVRRLMGGKRKLYASVLSQNALAACLVGEVEKGELWLAAAERCWEMLMDLSLRPASGMLAWGLPFDWQSSRQFYPTGTPFITQSAYAVEAGVALYVASGQERFAEDARAIGFFLRDGIYKEAAPKGGTRTSYGPQDRSFVYNTSAYRFFDLNLLKHHGILDSEGEDERALEYVLAGQEENGSWPYGDGPAYDYVDHYHTAFVIKCLVKYLLLGQDDERVIGAIRRGLDFYCCSLFDEASGLPKPYARAPRWNPFNLDGYDLAEAIGVFSLLLLLPSDVSAKFSDHDDLIRRLDGLMRFPFTKGRRSLWRRYGSITLYREYDRWAWAPYRLALTYANLQSVPSYLEPQTR